jgi:hypothetical protein
MPGKCSVVTSEGNHGLSPALFGHRNLTRVRRSKGGRVSAARLESPPPPTHSTEFDMTLHRRLGVLAVALGLALGVAACGSSTSDRALSGAGIGAGIGAAGAAITGGSLLGGAALGGAAGAATGALTDEDDVDLGKPVWD